MEFDLFISHASEDKDSIVRPLAQLLSDSGLRVWLDETEIKLGDSLRRSIEIKIRAGNPKPRLSTKRVATKGT